MNKLIGGFDTRWSTCRIYDLNGESVLADGRKAPCEIMEALAIYMTTPWEGDKDFRFFHRKDGIYCECVVRTKTYEAFVCGYGATEGEAFQECTTRLCDMKDEFTFRE